MDHPILPNYKGLLSCSSSPLFISWNNELNQLVVTNNLLVKNIKGSIDSQSDTIHYDRNSNSISLVNVQKINNLMRQSYSLMRFPLIIDAFPEITGNYNLDMFDTGTYDYLTRIGNQTIPNRRSTNNWSGEFNWYSFRYDYFDRDSQSAQKKYKRVDRITNREKQIIKEESNLGNFKDIEKDW